MSSLQTNLVLVMFQVFELDGKSVWVVSIQTASGGSLYIENKEDRNQFSLESFSRLFFLGGNIFCMNSEYVPCVRPHLLSEVVQVRYSFAMQQRLGP